MFPAYNLNSETIKPETGDQFLQNRSYDVLPVSLKELCEVISSSESSSESNDSLIPPPDEKDPAPKTISLADICYIDCDRKKEYLKLKSLPYRAIPFYEISKTYERNIKSRKYKRYFKSKKVKKLLNTAGTNSSVDVAAKDEAMRINLIKNPHQIDKWLQYIKFKVCSYKREGKINNITFSFYFRNQIH